MLIQIAHNGSNCVSKEHYSSKHIMLNISSCFSFIIFICYLAKICIFLKRYSSAHRKSYSYTIWFEFFPNRRNLSFAGSSSLWRRLSPLYDLLSYYRLSYLCRRFGFSTFHYRSLGFRYRFFIHLFIYYLDFIFFIY